jgi:hypothetical protein
MATLEKNKEEIFENETSKFCLKTGINEEQIIWM